MRKLFTAIKQGNFEEVQFITIKNPALVNSISKQPPKKDNGQSPLQIAIKYRQFDLADFLIDNGANIDFIEVESCNKWKMPVLHDAITAVFSCTRYLKKDVINKTWLINERDLDKAYKLLKKILNLGSNVDIKDSFGNSAIERATLDARLVLPRYLKSENDYDKPLNKELVKDINKIFKLLKKYNVDFNVTTRRDNKTVQEIYKDELVYRFIK